MVFVKVEDFSFEYPESNQKALEQLNFTLEKGSFNVLFGKSGSGKTTLLRQLKPSLTPHGKKSGKLSFDGKPLADLTFNDQSRQIGYVFQDPDQQLVTEKVWHELAFGLENLGVESATIRLQVAEMATYFGIQHWFHQDVANLSGGQKQLLNLASVMVLQPELLILDEPTAQLDPLAAGNFLEMIAKINREFGTTILLTEHRLQEAMPLADQVFLLDRGKLVASGSPGKVGIQLKKTANDLFSAMPAPMQLYAELPDPKNFPLTVREGRAWLDTLNLEALPSRSAKKLEKVSNPLIEVKNVWFRYTKESEDVVADFSLSVGRGDFFCIVGGNGAGKSTALSLISRLKRPYRGQIKLAGKKIGKYTEEELYCGFLGVLPQDPQSLFVKKTVLADLYEVIANNHGNKFTLAEEAQVAEVLELMQLTDLRERHPYDLSGGEQQRLALGKVLLTRPQILLLDEPTKGLDDFYKQNFGQLLQKLKKDGMTIVMVSHDLEFVAKYADYCGLFFEGALLATKTANDFFAGNNFYTTAANRMARTYFPNAVTIEEVKKCLQDQKIL